MSLPDKKLERLNQLLSAFDDGAIQPDELNQALEAVMTVIESANRELDQRINKSSENATGALSALENRVSQATSELQALIRQVKAEETTDKEELRKMVAAELLRIESKIPQIPEQFDATELYNDIQSHKEMLTGLSELIVGENIRNALEALPEGEKLVMEAIEGLPELLEKLSQMEGKGNVVGGVTRALVEQLIAESGGGSSLPDQTGNAGKFLNTDGTDASWETVSAGTVDVVSNVATDTILGRTTAGTGDSEQLTASAVRTLINVEDGATADQDLSGLLPKAGGTMTGNIALNGNYLSGDGGDEGVFVESSGNVGIGTSSPSAKLHIVDGANTYRFNDGARNITPNIALFGVSTKAVALLTGNNGSVFTFDDTGFFGIFKDSKANITGGNSRGGTALMTIKNSGNVGIGTMAPDTLLHNAGAYTQESLSSDPADPDAGNSVQWVSDGTGSGDAGDVLLKVNVGGTTKVITLIDYSVA